MALCSGGERRNTREKRKENTNLTKTLSAILLKTSKRNHRKERVKKREKREKKKLHSIFIVIIKSCSIDVQAYTQCIELLIYIGLQLLLVVALLYNEIDLQALMTQRVCGLRSNLLSISFSGVLKNPEKCWI